MNPSHGEDFMDFTRQSMRVAQADSTFLVSGDRTCIDGQQRSAHKLPDMTGFPAGSNLLAAHRAAIYLVAWRCNPRGVTLDAHS